MQTLEDRRVVVPVEVGGSFIHADSQLDASRGASRVATRRFHEKVHHLASLCGPPAQLATWRNCVGEQVSNWSALKTVNSLLVICQFLNRIKLALTIFLTLKTFHQMYNI